MTSILKRSATCVAALVLSTSASSAQWPSPAPPTTVGRTASAPHVKMELIADPAPGPDGRLWLGVRFDLDEHWHLYWVNPGDSGGAPEAQWTAPAHMKVGAFEWPAPERIETSGLVNYGYYGTLVLPVPVAVASDSRPAGTISAALRWLVCYDMCLPGKATVSITLPTSGDTTDAGGWQAAIARARTQVPGPAPASWTVRAEASKDTFDLIVSTGQREERGVFFPLEMSQINDSAPQGVTPLADGLRFTLRKSEQLVKDPAVLKGVVSLSGGRTFVVEAAVSRNDPRSVERPR